MTEFTLPDMSCNHCVQSITGALTSQDPTATVTVDLNSRTVSVQSRLADTQIRQILTETGYPPAA